jgi:fluoride exporter
MKWLLVFIGGGTGSICRFGISLLFQDFKFIFPWPTLIANVLAAGIIALLFYLEMKTNQAGTWLLLATGFCGGLSTFSAFSLETFQLMKDGNYWLASLNVSLSIVLCLVIIYFMSKLF